MTLRSVLSACVESLREGRSPALCTVVRTRGSAPAHVGDRMFVGPAHTVGTIGGGETELRVIERARRICEGGANGVFTYDLQYRKPGAVDLACGGSVDILIERLTSEQAPIMEAWLEELLYRRSPRTVTRIGGRDPGLLLLRRAGGAVLGFEGALGELAIGPTGERRGPDGSPVLVEEHRPPPHVLLFGGGHIQHALSRLLDLLEYDYTVVDARPAFLSEQRFPRARFRFIASPSAFLASGGLGDFSHAVVCCHTRQADLDAVKGLLERGFNGYIGLIGSRSKKKDFARQLVGLPFDRVQIPIGIDLGARSVPEIALSIAAALVRDRNRVTESGP